MLQGFYLKPTLHGGVYEENILNKKSNVQFAEVRTVVYGSSMIELGNQWIFSEQIMLDLFLGFGLCFDNIKHINGVYSNFSSANHAHHFNTIRTDKNGGAISGGLKIGMLLGKKKE